MEKYLLKRMLAYIISASYIKRPLKLQNFFPVHFVTHYRKFKFTMFGGLQWQYIRIIYYEDHRNFEIMKEENMGV